VGYGKCGVSYLCGLQLASNDLHVTLSQHVLSLLLLHDVQLNFKNFLFHCVLHVAAYSSFISIVI